MAPPQVNLNDKPKPEISEQDPLPEKAGDAILQVNTVPRLSRASLMTAEQRRQRKRCRVACCLSLSVLLVILLALGSACLVYRMKHRKSWRSFCGTTDNQRVPENVTVDHHNQTIRVAPQVPTGHALDMLHEYNRHLLAFRNSSANTCYIDRLDETFSEGYARWQGYENQVHKQQRTLRIVPQRIQIEVVHRFVGVHIVEHCGGVKVDYYWALEMEATAIRRPNETYIVV